MRYLLAGILCFLISSASAQSPDPVSAADSLKRIEKIDKLLALTQIEAKLQVSAIQHAEWTMKTTKAFRGADSVVYAFFRSAYNFDTLKPYYRQAYWNRFRTREIEDLIQFFSSPAGQKYLGQRPELLQELTDIPTNSLKQRAPRLQGLVHAYLLKQQSRPSASSDNQPNSAADNEVEEEVEGDFDIDID